MEKTNEQKELVKLIGKLLRDNFGRGPEFINVCMSSNYLCVYLKNFMSPMERILMSSSKEDILGETRDALIQALFPEIKAYIKIVVGLDVQEFYYDWGLQNQSGLLFFICSNQVLNQQPIQLEYPGKDLIHDEFYQLSAQMEKSPAQMESFLLDSILVVVRTGLLVSVEKEFLRMGLLEQLKLAKRNLEKKYFHNDIHFSTILQRNIEDRFSSYDFHKDKCITVFILN